MKIKIAISPCPNDVFIYSGLITKEIATDEIEWDFTFLELEYLNRAAVHKQYDVVKISYAHFPRVQKDYQLLPCGGAMGRNCGPLLITGGNPFDANLEILIPGQYTTAHLLLVTYLQRVLGPQAEKIKKRFLPFDKIYSALQANPSAQGVIIHEMRFTYVGDGLKLVQDLGENWESQTGFPIPLGALVMRNTLSDFKSLIESQVRKSLSWAYSNSNQALKLCRQHSQSMDESVLQAHISLYVNDFSRDVGSEGNDAIQFLLRMAQ